MNYFPQIPDPPRGARFRLTDTTPAILQFQNGRRMAGELHVISLQGGLLLLPESVQRGSIVELMFHTPKGPVLGTAEMLRPITDAQQPFRFVAMPELDQRTLRAAFQSSVYRNTDQEERFEELRATVANWNPHPRWRLRVFRLGIGLVAALGCLLCIIYRLRH